jgi:CrcB protein
LHKVLIIGCGGFLGAISRYGVGWLYAKVLPITTFPYSTFTVNILGCLLFGIIAGLALERTIITPELKYFLLVGFLGSFTTFSTYSFDSFFLLREGHEFVMLLNVVLQTVLGIFVAALGYDFAQRLLGH